MEGEKERVVQSLEGKLHREPFPDQFVTQEVTALAVSEHLTHPGFFSLQPGDLSFLNFKGNSDCYRAHERLRMIC